MEKILLYLVLFSLVHIASAQDCATTLSEIQKNYLQQNRHARNLFAAQSSIQKTGTISYIPVQFHIVRQTGGTGGINPIILYNELDSVNARYAPANMQFYPCAPVHYIDDTDLYDFSFSEEPLLCNPNDVPNVLNIYYVNSIGGGGVCGYAYFPPSPDRILMANPCANNGKTLAHEIGHYFSLYHTHGKTNGSPTDELVDGSNCTTHGDDLCDTPADPNLNLYGDPDSLYVCRYYDTYTDTNGMMFNPLMNNIMSYAPYWCVNAFTTGQYNRMIYSKNNDRNYLSCTNAPVADFYALNTTVCAGQPVQLKDISTALPTSWTWTFTGGTPSSSTVQHPVVTYNTPGVYPVSLTVSNTVGSHSVTKTAYITVISGTSLPLTQDFESTTFPPAQWTVNNPDNGKTWEHITNIIGKSGLPTKATYVNHYNYYTLLGAKDELVSEKISLSGASNPKLIFDVAYARYYHTIWERLRVLVSTDCGQTFTEVYNKSGNPSEGNTLPTRSDTAGYWKPWLSSHWRTDTVSLASFAGSPSVIIKFETTNGYSNNLFIDNINIDGLLLNLNTDNTAYSDLSIYPNPYTDNITVQGYAQEHEQFFFTFYNTLGQVVYQKKQLYTHGQFLFQYTPPAQDKILFLTVFSDKNPKPRTFTLIRQ